jgi:hypothetical protein
VCAWTNGRNVKPVAETSPATADPVSLRTSAQVARKDASSPSKIAVLVAPSALPVTTKVGKPSRPATRFSSEYASVPACG